MEGVKDKFSEIISANHFDILHALSDACVNTGEKQGEFLKVCFVFSFLNEDMLKKKLTEFFRVF